MTGERANVTTPNTVVKGGEYLTDPVSLGVAQDVAIPFIDVLADYENPFSQVAMDRLARMNPKARQGFVNALLADPSGSGIKYPRYQLDDRAPLDETGEDIDKLIVLWTAESKDVPKLKVPERLMAPVLDFSRRLGMMGGTEHMLATEEAAKITITKNTIIHNIGAANLANRVRLQTVNEVLKNQAPGVAEKARIIASVDASRLLKPVERDKVRDFAPDAINELDLFVASALSEGYVGHEDNLKGSKVLPDGSICSKFIHEELGTELLVIYPKKQVDLNGKSESGVYNAYAALEAHGAILLGDGFTLNGIDIVHVNSSHYMPMGVLNNLDATSRLGIQLGGFKAIGDVQPQPNRPVLAYCVEFGLFLNRIESLPPKVREVLLTAE